LAGESTADEIDLSAPFVPVEGPHVVPYRESREDSIGLTLKQHAPRTGLDFNGANGSVSEQQACVESTAPSGK
jgi:hypothetical protein